LTANKASKLFNSVHTWNDGFYCDDFTGGYSDNGKSDDSKNNDHTGIIVAVCVVIALLILIAIIVSVAVVMYCKKRSQRW